MEQRSLFERLGGSEAISAVVDDFVARCAADSRINGKFARTDIPRLKKMLVDQVTAATGGPANYTGRDMKTVHAGMGVTGAQFDALASHLVAALEAAQVKAGHVNPQTQETNQTTASRSPRSNRPAVTQR